MNRTIRNLLIVVAGLMLGGCASNLNVMVTIEDASASANLTDQNPFGERNVSISLIKSSNGSIASSANAGQDKGVLGGVVNHAITVGGVAAGALLAAEMGGGLPTQIIGGGIGGITGAVAGNALDKDESTSPSVVMP